MFKPSTDAESLLGSIKKKFFDCGEGFAWGGLAKLGCFRFIDQFDGPWTPIAWTKILAQTVFGTYTISRVDRAFAWLSSMSGTKVMAQKPHFAPKSENCRKCMSLPLAATVAHDNSPLEDARELYEPLKNSWSLLVCTEKKNFRFGFWVFGGWGLKKGSLDFFLIVSLWRHRLHKGSKFWLKISLDSRLEYEALEALIDFLAFLVPK